MSPFHIAREQAKLLIGTGAWRRSKPGARPSEALGVV
jgi:hypothetical protein